MHLPNTKTVETQCLPFYSKPSGFTQEISNEKWESGMAGRSEHGGRVMAANG